jgi:YVTN family beta-propeller protein
MKMLACALLCALSLSGAELPSGLRPLPTIALPGVSGRFDHFAVDLKTNRLFVAALGNNTVEVIDVAGSARLKTIAGLRKPQGVAFLPASNQLVVASGDDGTLKIFNGSTYILEHTLSGFDDADNVRVYSAANMLYVGYGDGALGVVDAATFEKKGEIKLAGHPESFQLEKQGSRIFVNVPDANHVAVIDRVTQRVVATWPVTDFRAHFPMTLDETNQRLFIGCRQPARLVVLDTATGRRVTDLEISGDTDDLFYDASRKRIYISCGAGFVDVIAQQSADSYTLRERLPTSSGARTSFYSPELNRLFLAIPQRGGQTSEIRTFQAE